MTFAQALILLWAVGLVAGTLLLLFFLMMPFRRTLAEKEGKIIFMESRLHWLGSMIAGDKDPDHVMNSLMRTKQELARKFPDEEHRSLAMLSEYANKFRLQMKHIQSEPPQVFMDSRGKALTVDLKTCTYVYATMKLKGDYVNLIKYLEVLDKVLPAYMTVERLEIENRSPAEPRLEVNAEIALYLLER